MKSYTCPHCKKKQTEIIEWVKASKAYEISLDPLEAQEEEIDEVIGEHETYTCPECGENIDDPNLVRKIREATN